MAQTGYTPIQLYYSATTTNVPLAGNLAAGELAINTADGKLFYKDSGGTVQVIATASGASGTVTSVAVSGGSTGLTTSGGPITSSGTITLAGTLAVANGGTGATTASGARTNFGATTLGGNLFTIANPSAVTFPQFNADNTVSALDAATFRAAIGAGTGGGSVSSVTGTGTVNGITLTGTVTSTGNLTLGGTLSGVSLTTQVTGTLPVANGGTGQTSYAVGDLVYASTTTALSKLADVATGNALISGGVGVAPSYGKIGLTTHISGTLAATNGGTGQSSYAVGDLVYASTTTALSKLADVATGNALISGGVGVAPSYGKIGLTTHVSGTLPVANGGTGATTLTGIVKGNGTGAFTAVTAPTGTIVGTTDTQTLTNKTIRQMTQVISTNTTAAASNIYVLTSSLTLTLPASPTAGDWVGFSNRSGTTTPVIARNGQNIMGLAENMTLDDVNASGTLVYADATRGWVFVD